MNTFFKFVLCLFILAVPASLSFAQTESGETNEYNDFNETNSESSSESTPEGQEGTKLGMGMPEPLVRDGAYDKIGVKEKIALGYDHVREADVFWSKRIWRVVDVRQKQNKTFVYEQQPFINVLFDIIDNNPEVQLFSTDAFTEQVSASDIANKLGSSDTIEVYDIEKEEYVQQVVTNDFNASTISKFRFKEDWIFDEETSTMLCRILGIAPIRDVLDDNGNFRGQEAMFWVYYPDIRKYLCRYETFNPFNDAIKLTWEDIMEMRLFDSYVMKEANVFDQRIEDNFDGRARLLESDRIETEIFHKEHDLWSY